MTTETLKLELKLLEKTKATLAKGWTQGEFARDKEGKGVRAHDRRACSFCIVGALSKSSCILPENNREDVYELAHDTLERTLNSMTNDPNLDLWNDDKSRTHDEVLDLIDVAMDSLKAKISE